MTKKNNPMQLYFFIRRNILLSILLSIIFGSAIFAVGFFFESLLAEIVGIIIILIGLYIVFSYFLSSLSLDFINLIGFVIQHADLNGSEQILDVGCGTGRMGIFFAKRLTSGKVIGIDIWDKRSWMVISISDSSKFHFLKKIKLTKNSIDLAYRHAKAEGVEDRIEFQYGNVLEIPFRDNTFEIITCNSVLNSLKQNNEEKLRALAEMKRVLKTNGKCIIIEPLRGVFGFHLFSPFAYLYLSSEKDFEKLVQDASFSITQKYFKRGLGVFFLRK